MKSLFFLIKTLVNVNYVLKSTLYSLGNVIVTTEKLYVDILDMKLHAIDGKYTKVYNPSLLIIMLTWEYICVFVSIANIEKSLMRQHNDLSKVYQYMC